MIDAIKALEGLHDVILTQLLWRPKENRLELTVRDLYANFRGLPEYKGPTEATFVFTGVRQFDMQVNLCTEGLMIYDWKGNKVVSDSCTSEFFFSPEGRVSLVFEDLKCLTK